MKTALARLMGATLALLLGTLLATATAWLFQSLGDMTTSIFFTVASWILFAITLTATVVVIMIHVGLQNRVWEDRRSWTH